MANVAGTPFAPSPAVGNSTTQKVGTWLPADAGQAFLLFARGYLNGANGVFPPTLDWDGEIIGRILVADDASNIGCAVYRATEAQVAALTTGAITLDYLTTLATNYQISVLGFIVENGAEALVATVAEGSTGDMSVALNGTSAGDFCISIGAERGDQGGLASAIAPIAAVAPTGASLTQCYLRADSVVATGDPTVVGYTDAAAELGVIGAVAIADAPSSVQVTAGGTEFAEHLESAAIALEESAECVAAVAASGADVAENEAAPAIVTATGSEYAESIAVATRSELEAAEHLQPATASGLELAEHAGGLEAAGLENAENASDRISATGGGYAEHIAPVRAQGNEAGESVARASSAATDVAEHLSRVLETGTDRAEALQEATASALEHAEHDTADGTVTRSGAAFSENAAAVRATRTDLAEHTAPVHADGLELAEHAAGVRLISAGYAEHSAPVAAEGVEAAEGLAPVLEAGAEVAEHTSGLVAASGLEYAEHLQELGVEGIEFLEHQLEFFLTITLPAENYPTTLPASEE